MRKHLQVVSAFLTLGILMGCSSKPKFNGCVGPNDCRPQEQETNSALGMAGNGAFAVSKIDISANDMVWAPASQQIFLSVPSSSGANGNTITALNPSTAQLGLSVKTGSEPDRLAVSSDGSYLYAGIDGTASVQRFTLPNLTPDNASV